MSEINEKIYLNCACLFEANTEYLVNKESLGKLLILCSTSYRAEMNLKRPYPILLRAHNA